MRAGSATLADVARRAGVSLATASRAFNGAGGRRVTPELREKVLAAAAELHYSPNAAARAMVLGRSELVGLVVHDIADPYFATVAAGAMAEAAESGLLVTVASTQRDPLREIAHVDLFRQQRARAVLLVGSRVDDRGLLEAMRAGLRELGATGVPVATVGQDALDVDAVVVENRLGAAALARALHGRGYRRFLVLAGPPGLVTARDRTEGFLSGLRECGVDAERVRIVEGGFTRDEAHRVTSDLFASGGPDCDCVFAVNDVMAVGALAALREHGVPVPGRVGVAGFDDIETLRDVTPSLTTVALPLEEMGRLALRMALDGGQDHPSRRHRVEGVVVLRDSTPGPAAS